MSIALDRSVFTHIPKCGGSSVRQFLQTRNLIVEPAPGDAHACPEEEGGWEHAGKPHWCLLREPGPWHWSHYQLIVLSGIRLFNPAGELVRDRWEGNWNQYKVAHMGLLGRVYERYVSQCAEAYPMETLLGSVQFALWRFEKVRAKGSMPFLNRGSGVIVSDEARAWISYYEPVAQQMWLDSKAITSIINTTT